MDYFDCFVAMKLVIFQLILLHKKDVAFIEKFNYEG
jgi:hypothetical protein